MLQNYELKVLHRLKLNKLVYECQTDMIAANEMQFDYVFYRAA